MGFVPEYRRKERMVQNAQKRREAISKANAQRFVPLTQAEIDRMKRSAEIRRGCYYPHNGKQEKMRRVRQMARAGLRALLKEAHA